MGRGNDHAAQDEELEVMVSPLGVQSSGLTTDKIIGIVFGGLAMLVILVVIITIFIVLLVSHRHRRKKGGEGIHAIINTTLSNNTIRAPGEIVILSEYSSAESACAIPQCLSLSLKGQQTGDCSSTCYHVHPNMKCTIQ